jgi:hypothetical protein
VQRGGKRETHRQKERDRNKEREKQREAVYMRDENNMDTCKLRWRCDISHYARHEILNACHALRGDGNDRVLVETTMA